MRHESQTHHRHAREQYLEAAVRTASPAKLRLMLIEKAIQVAGMLSARWGETPGQRGANEDSILLLDLLSELLSGVTSRESEVCVKVADLYVFLCKELVKAEEAGDARRIDQLRDVLLIEAETWREVCAQEQHASTPAPVDSDSLATSSAGLNLQA